MARDLKKQAEWQKARYTRILADIDKNLGIEFKEKIANDKISISKWMTEEIKKYLKK